MANIQGQELLDLLNAAQDDTNLNVSKRDAKQVNINVFIHSRPLEPGNARVGLHQIYVSYLEFSKKRMSYRHFIKYLRKAGFYIYKGMNLQYIKLNPKPLGLPDNYDIAKDPNEISSVKRGLHKWNYIGVWGLPDGTFIARMLLESGVYAPLGRYDTAKEAAYSYDVAALQLHGKDAVLNFKNLWKGLINGTQSSQVEDKNLKRKIRKVISDYFKKQKQRSKSIEVESRTSEDTETSGEIPSSEL